MEDAPTGVTDDKPTVQEDTPMPKEGEPSVPTATETNAPLEEKMEASYDGDTEMTSPSVANKEAPNADVIGDSAAAETNPNSSDPAPAPMHEPSRSASPIQ